MNNILCQKLGIQYPLFCGAMYPCSNPELVAEASKVGALGVVQPLSLTYVHGYDFKKGLDKINQLSGNKPIGLNALIEASSQRYLQRMKKWVQISLDSGVKVFVTALGKPDWVVKLCESYGAFVFHDVTTLKWAKIAHDCGVHGLICVNDQAGGHVGELSAQQLIKDVSSLNLMTLSAGGYSNQEDCSKVLEMGYDGIQMGTRFIASKECQSSEDYKKAIVKALAKDIVHSHRITGVPVSVINTDYVQEVGTEASFVMRKMLGHNKLKHYARLWYTLKSIWSLKKSSQAKQGYKSYWQAGKSVQGIHQILTVEEIVHDLFKTDKS